jgi:hypothetical protein
MSVHEDSLHSFFLIATEYLTIWQYCYIFKPFISYWLKFVFAVTMFLP